VAHCPPAELDDLADLLAELRTWTGVVEKKPNVFYVRRAPFLHFHLVDGGRRRADIKGARAGWTQRDLPRPLSAARRRAFLRELRMRHGEKLSATLPQPRVQVLEALRKTRGRAWPFRERA
jgi:hypothetical protein